MITFVVDDLSKPFVNLYPLKHQDSDISLTEPWHLPKWLEHYSINYNIVGADHATPESWYPVGINFWDARQDYLSALPDKIKELLVQDRLRLLFTYREADDPGHIREHIDLMCQSYGIHPDSVLLISGNTQADGIQGCMSFWYFDSNYFFQTLSSPPPDIIGSKSRKITCLSRTHKQWRECFVYNILRHAQDENYISYGLVDNVDAKSDFVMWHENNLGIFELYPIDVKIPNQDWRDRLPLTIDSLTSDQHNDHSITVTEHFQNSYWNIVLETLLDGGIFITEKTLKPIRNGQAFVVLGCQHSLAYLREHGYQTFGNVIDESYDAIPDVRRRWYTVYGITKEILKMSREDLHNTWQKCLPMIQHNQQHFQRSREPAIRDLVTKLINYRP